MSLNMHWNENRSDSDLPQTQLALEEWFKDTKNIRQLRQMIKYQISQDDELYAIKYIWRRIVGTDILCLNPSCGLMDRSGKIYGCGFAQHDELARLMGWEIANLEREGWVRFDANSHAPRAYCETKPSQEQINRLAKWGLDQKFRDSHV